MQKGFLNDKDRQTLYGPEGSGEVRLTEEQKRRMDENEMQHKANKQMHDMMNRGGGSEVAPWYNSNFPKGCQYNSPGCALEELKQSVHASPVHVKLVCDSQRWKEVVECRGLTEVRLPYCSLKDSDLPMLFEKIIENHNDTLRVLDLSCNDLMDAGAQIIAVALSKPGAVPHLEELRIFSNKMGKLGETILLSGLSVFRKKLQVTLQTPEYLK